MVYNNVFDNDGASQFLPFDMTGCTKGMAMSW